MPLTLHGRIANQPAHFVEVRVGVDAPHELTVIGRVEEGGLFFPHLQLTASVITVPGSNPKIVVQRRGREIAGATAAEMRAALSQPADLRVSGSDSTKFGLLSKNN